MSAKLYVQIWQDGVCLQEIPFTAERFQVGRLPDNDVVINHLSVSRCHALLEREGDQIAVQDLGSQNGVWADGQRLESRAVFPIGSSIRIGQHELRFSSAESSLEGEAVGPEPEPGHDLSSEVRMEPVAEDALASFAIGEDELGVADADRPAEGVDLGIDELFGEDDDTTSLIAAPLLDESPLEPPAAEVEAISIPDLEGDEEPLSIPSLDERADDLPPAEVSHEEMVGLPFDESQEGLEWKPQVEPGAGDAPGMYAGLIVQRGGALESVLPWDADEMFAGRGSECEILLAEPEVSRKHAVFVRNPDGSYVVRDLGSINGVFVNDQKVDERALAVGDIVRIESFALTFLLDHQPIGTEVQLPEPAAPSPGADLERGHLTVLGELPPLDAAPPVSGSLPALDLFDEALEEAGDPEAKDAGGTPLKLELEVSMAELPESLRRTLQELGDRVVELPVKLRIRR